VTSKQEQPTVTIVDWRLACPVNRDRPVAQRKICTICFAPRAQTQTTLTVYRRTFITQGITCALALRCSIFPASAHEVERRSVEGATRLPAPPNATRGPRGFSCSDVCYCSEMRYVRPARTEVAVGSRIDVLVGPRKQSLTAREIEPSWPTAPNPVMWSRCEDERRPCVIQCSPAYAGCLG
jgi:hypothetical protein